MSKISARRPSPALVISVLALFVALGGSAYAASKIGTKDIKANAITAGKIKKNAVTTAKIKKEAVTGAKIKESSLGAVPNAINATNAVNATNFSRYFTSGLKKAGPGANVSLGSVGPFSFVGKCKDIGGGDAQAGIYITTTATNSYFYSAIEAIEGGSEGGFDPGDEEPISFQPSTLNPAWLGGSAGVDGFSATSPDGSTILDGAANAGAGVFGSPCAFQVWALNGA
jgi:hypothetical protein